jgi:hypothetical protein
MFNFFKKFKSVSGSDGEGKGERERAGSSLMVPARRRDDKGKDKISGKEREVGVSSFDAHKTSLAASAGVKIKDTGRKFGEVKEPVLVQQFGKNEPVIVKADDTYTDKSNVQGATRVKAMGNTTTTMTSSVDADDIGKNSELAKSAATHTHTVASHDEKHQRKAGGTWTDGSRSNYFASRTTPTDVAMVTKAQLDEQPAEGNDLTQNIHHTEPSSMVDNPKDMEKQVEEQQSEK